MKLTNVIGAVLGATLLCPQAGYCQKLIAAGTLDASGGDLSKQTAKPLENGAPGNLFGGIGSGLGLQAVTGSSPFRIEGRTRSRTTTASTTRPRTSPGSTRCVSGCCPAVVLDFRSC